MGYYPADSAVPYTKASDLTAASSVAQQEKFMVVNASGSPVLVEKQHTGFTRLFVDSVPPTGTFVAGKDIWIDTSGTYGVLKVWNGSTWDNRGYVHPNHTGDVSSTGDGVTVIGQNKVTNAKLSDVPASTVKGNLAGTTGDPQDITLSALKTALGIDEVSGLSVGTEDGDIALLSDGGIFPVSTIPSVDQLSGTLPILSGGTGATSTEGARSSLDVMRSMSDTIIVKSEADLPAASGGIIQLEDNKTYIFSGTVGIGANKIVAGAENIISGFNAKKDIIASSAADWLISSSDKNLVVVDIGLRNTVGGIFDFSSTTSANSLFIRNVSIEECSKVGSISSSTMSSIDIFRTTILSCSSGFSFTGSFSLISVDKMTQFGDIGSSEYGLSIDAAAQTVSLSDILFNSDTETCVYINPASIDNGILRNVINTGTSTTLTGVDHSTIKWQIRSVSGEEDSYVGAYMYLAGNDSATDITSIGGWVKVAGATSVSYLSKMSSDASNKITYGGLSNYDLTINAAITGVSGSGTQQDHELAIAVNGTIDTTTISSLTTRSAGLPVSCSIHSILSLNEGDYIELYARNNTSTTDVTISELQMVVS